MEGPGESASLVEALQRQVAALQAEIEELKQAAEKVAQMRAENEELREKEKAMMEERFTDAQELIIERGMRQLAEHKQEEDAHARQQAERKVQLLAELLAGESGGRATLARLLAECPDFRLLVEALSLLQPADGEEEDGEGTAVQHAVYTLVQLVVDVVRPAQAAQAAAAAASGLEAHATSNAPAPAAADEPPSSHAGAGGAGSAFGSGGESDQAEDLPLLPLQPLQPQPTQEAPAPAAEEQLPPALRAQQGQLQASPQQQPVDPACNRPRRCGARAAAAATAEKAALADGGEQHGARGAGRLERLSRQEALQRAEQLADSPEIPVGQRQTMVRAGDGWLYHGYLPVTLGLPRNAFFGMDVLCLMKLGDSLAARGRSVMDAICLQLLALAGADKLAPLASKLGVPADMLSRAVQRMGQPKLMKMIELDMACIYDRSATAAAPTLGFRRVATDADGSGAAPKSSTQMFAVCDRLLSLPHAEVVAARRACLQWMVGLRGELPVLKALTASFRINPEWNDRAKYPQLAAGSGGWAAIKVALAEG